MIRSLLEHIDGIATFPIISLVLFFIFFVTMVIMVLRLDENYLNSLKSMPLEKASDLTTMGDKSDD